MLLGGHTIIYGGSFDPPHMGHQMVCLYLLEGLGAAELLLTVAWHHPFGKRLAPFEHRLAMTRLLAQPFGHRIQVSEVERHLGGEGHTYATLRHLTSSWPNKQFALAVGADVLGETASWYKWPEIENLVPVIVVGRTGYGAGAQALLDLPPVSSTEIRSRLSQGLSVEGLLPVSVGRYIAAQGLYQVVTGQR